YPVARIAEAPYQTNVYIVDGDAPPAGVGEPGVPPFVAALCNAIFAATGKRPRDLPITKLGLGWRSPRLWMGECPELEGRIARKGKTVNQDKARHHMIFGSLILFVLFGGLTLYVVSIVESSPGPDSAASNATFRAKCAMCHGQDGGGSEVGKSMNVPDLRSPAV